MGRVWRRLTSRVAFPSGRSFGWHENTSPSLNRKPNEKSLCVAADQQDTWLMFLLSDRLADMKSDRDDCTKFCQKLTVTSPVGGEVRHEVRVNHCQ